MNTELLFLVLSLTVLELNQTYYILENFMIYILGLEGKKEGKGSHKADCGRLEKKKRLLELSNSSESVPVMVSYSCSWVSGVYVFY